MGGLLILCQFLHYMAKALEFATSELENRPREESNL